MVMLKVIPLALLFLVRLRFPVDKSIACVLRSRYGNTVVKDIRQFEKIDFALRRCKLDLLFLETCLENQIIPKFLNFRVSNLHLKTSRAYHACQPKLLREEISFKRSRIKTLENDFNTRKRKLRGMLGIIDYTHVCCLFLNKNDKKLKNQQDIHSKKLFNLGIESSKMSHDPQKVIFNYSSHVLTESEKSLLCKGLNFAIPPDKLEYSDFLLPFELLYRDIQNLDVIDQKKQLLKARIKDGALSSFSSYNKNSAALNLTKEEFASLKSLSKNDSLIIQKSDKGNSIAIVDKDDYLQKERNILSDSNKFSEVFLTNEKHLNFLVNIEKQITDLLKQLNDSQVISHTEYKKLKPRGSRFGILYGLCKIHKSLIDNCPPFRPILSAIKTPSYNIAKFLVPILEPITTNKFTIKNSFEFAKDVINQDSGLYMASLDVESLFTNIPLEETINISCDSLFSNEAKINNFNRNDFEKLFRMALQNNFFNFDGKIYKQTDGVAMGSPLGPSLANAFLCFHEQIWLNDCPEDFKPVYYRRYVDDIFALFRSQDHLEKFTNYLNWKHKNIKFTDDKESNNSLPFLDILISRSENGFKTSIYHKPTFRGVYSNFNSFIYHEYKIGLVFTMLFRTFSIVSDFSRFHTEAIHLKEILRKNAFPITLVDNCIKNFLNKKFLNTPVTLTVKKKELFIVLPYLGNLSLALRTRLQNSINKNLPFYKIKVIFKSTIRLSNFFRFKDKMPFNLRSNVVYKFSCGRCNATYYGETCRHLNVRVGEHSGISPLTGKKSKARKTTAVKDHMLFCDHMVSLDDFRILTSSNSEFHLKIKESL